MKERITQALLNSEDQSDKLIMSKSHTRRFASMPVWHRIESEFQAGFQADTGHFVIFLANVEL